MEYYQFKPEDAERFYQSLGLPYHRRGNELFTKQCPYCRGTGRDNENTFSINLVTGQFKCLRDSCGASGNLITLAKDFRDFDLGTDVNLYYNIANKHTRKYREFKAPKKIESHDKAVEYCLSRGISEEVCKKYELTVRKDDEHVLVFPFRDESGTVQFVKYRKTNFQKGVDRNKEWCEADGKAILFGMNHCDMTIPKLILTEGQLDSLSVATAGIPNAVSVPTGSQGQTWIPSCWNFLQGFAELIIFGDCEKGHVTLVEMMRNRFGGVIKVVREGDYQGCKDANEILQKFGKDGIIRAVEGAQPIPVPEIKCMSSIKSVNLLTMDGIRTYIPKLDEVLNKLYYGQVILLTGQRGDGKSTWMNQLVCNALNQGIATFVYSGELPNHVVRNFTDTMISGKHESDLRDEDIRKMSDWYNNRLFIYDDGCDSHNVLGIVEKAITQYGCKLVCLDNLMTIVESDGKDSLYALQGKFVGDLTRLAKKHSVVIILVAHPRKMAIGQYFTNDDVSGSSDITNKVDVVMSYQRVHDAEESNENLRELWITKNRLTGKLATGDNAIKLAYDPKSRRIGISPNFRYEPYTDNYGFYDVEDTELPF